MLTMITLFWFFFTLITHRTLDSASTWSTSKLLLPLLCLALYLTHMLACPWILSNWIQRVLLFTQKLHFIIFICNHICTIGPYHHLIIPTFSSRHFVRTYGQKFFIIGRLFSLCPMQFFIWNLRYIIGEYLNTLSDPFVRDFAHITRIFILIIVYNGRIYALKTLKLILWRFTYGI